MSELSIAASSTATCVHKVQEGNSTQFSFKHSVLSRFIFDGLEPTSFGPAQEKLLSNLNTCLKVFFCEMAAFYQHDVESFTKAIGAETSQTPLKKVQKAFRQIMGDAVFDSFRGQANPFQSSRADLHHILACEQYKSARIALWEELSEIIEEPLPSDLEAASGLKVKMMMLQWIKEHQSKLDTITELDLVEMDLVMLPPEISYLNNLVVLNLYGNELRCLPDAIGQLRKLEVLICDLNELTSLPDSLCNLSHLRELRLAQNQIKYFPSAMSHLNNLEKVCIKGQLQILLAFENDPLPAWASQLYQPSRIKLWKKLAQLINQPFPYHPDSATPQEVEADLRKWLAEHQRALSQVTRLSLAKMKLKLLPPEVCFLRNLETLQLNDNKLKFLPKALENLKQLKTLYLEGNHKLLALPAGLEQLPQLSRLVLDYETAENLDPSSRLLKIATVQSSS